MAEIRLIAHAEKMRIDELARRLRAVDPRAMLVPERALQRIIRFERRLSTLDIVVPHTHCYHTTRDRLIDFTSRYEFHLNIDRATTDEVILLAQPEDDELEKTPASYLLYDTWRQLFHIRVHLALQGVLFGERLSASELLEVLRRLGPLEFAEIRTVLYADERLLPPINPPGVLVEFAATFLELWYFAPSELAWHFPALDDYGQVAELLAEHLDHDQLYRETRLEGADTLDVMERVAGFGEGHRPTANLDTLPSRQGPRTFRRLVHRANRLANIGNHAKAAIIRQKSIRSAPPGRASEALAQSQQELAALSARLCQVLGMDAPEDIEEMQQSLEPLLQLADRGFRTIESRMLHDLQTVCIESERGVYAVDLFRWARSLGNVPLKRPLPLLREVLCVRRLNSALEKLRLSRLNSEDARRLANLLDRSVHVSQARLRDHVRPILKDVFRSEGCYPGNIPERVALQKIIDELLDRIVQRGHLSIGHLRDAISQNNLKLSDLVQLRSLFTGDLLLRLDRRLARELDGIYHRGPIYLRATHRLSSLAFGTHFGRILSRYVALPFGGAYLVLESIRHIVHFLAPHAEHGLQVDAAGREFVSSVAPETATEALPSLRFGLAIFGLGLAFLLLIESPAFRAWCLQLLARLGQGLVYLFRDLPKSVMKLPWVRGILESDAFRTVVNYGLKPAVVTTTVLLLIDRIAHWVTARHIVETEIKANVLNWNTWTVLFLLVNLFLNSPLGRYTDAMMQDQLRRGWRELQIKVFAALFHFIVDSFQWVLKTLEEIIYTVDELLRFRTGEHWYTLLFKGIIAAVWSVISYIVRIYTTLLIEPQINPIKHFPVVTVSHKMILPFSVTLIQLMATPLAPFLGGFVAGTIATATVFLLPGVFGFLAWELKENWRLYASNRRRFLTPIPVGSHGESIVRLLRVGFHSGTLPRVFGRLRRTSRRAWKSGNSQPVRKNQQNLHHVEEAARAFFERELLALLRELPDWRPIPLEVAHLHVATNEIEVSIGRGAGDGPCVLAFQELGGWLIACCRDPGWTTQLDARRSRQWSTALRGLFKYAGIDVVWDELLAGLNVDPYFFEFNRDGMLAWVGPDMGDTTQFKLRDAGATAQLAPAPRRIVEFDAEDEQQLFFSATPISWLEWIKTWESLAAAPDARDRRERADADKAAGCP